MENVCSIGSCQNRVAFRCKCKNPAVLICDQHFSSHIKIQRLEHQYEFIPSPLVPASNKAAVPNKIKNHDLQKMIENLPASTKQSLFKSPALPNGSAFKKPVSSNAPVHDQYEKITYSESEYYEGEVQNSQEHGYGKFIGIFQYEGEWRNGLPHGQGVFAFGSLKFSGKWYSGLMNGPGHLQFVNGDHYEGEFTDGKMHGEGKYSFKDTTVIQGFFTNCHLVTNNFCSAFPFEYLTALDELKKSATVNIVKRFEILGKIFHCNLEIVLETDSNQNNIRFFKNNSLVMVTVDYEKCEKSEECLISNAKFSNLAGICEVDDYLFHVGGLIGEKSTGNCFIINTITLEVTWLESCQKRSSPCAIKLLNYIYVFGGSDLFLSFLNSCEIYDLEQHKWGPLPSLPSPADGMTGTSLGNYIVLSGYLHTKAYVFDSKQQFYYESLDLPDFKDKIFCSGSGKVYAMCNKKLYESNCGNPFEWTFLRDIVYAGGWTSNAPIKKGKIFYWYTTDKEIWKFDIDTKGVFLLKKFK